MKLRNMIVVGLTSIAAIAVAAPQLVQADTATCTGPGCNTNATPLSVTFSVTIPSVLRFQLGATGLNPAVAFGSTVTATNIGNGTAVSADSVTNGGPGADGVSQVYYHLASTQGATNVQISAAGVGATLVSGLDTIPYNTITAVQTGNIAMPVAGGAPTTVLPTGGVINETGFWSYRFANAAVYPAGIYTGTINYTATHTP